MAERVEHPEGAAERESAHAAVWAVLQQHPARSVGDYNQAAEAARVWRCVEAALDAMEPVWVATGRKLAADAIRAYGERDEDLPPGNSILLSRDLAAQLAEGTTDG